MPKLKKKKSNVDEATVLENEVLDVPEDEAEEGIAVDEDTADVEEDVVGNEDENTSINEDEEIALAEQEEAEATNTVHTDKLNKALKVVHDTFNLHGYSVMSFKDSGSKVKVAVTNGDFDLEITVRDCESHGIY